MSDPDQWEHGIPWSAFGGNEVVTALKASRQRIEGVFADLLSGYALRAEDVLNEVARVNDYSGLVGMRGISYYSLCAHHFLPFFGAATVVYEPGDVITGLGKIVRLVKEVHARRLQIQELMAKSIADDLVRVLNVKGVAVITTAKHLCICSRGPSDDSADAIAFYATGTLAGYTISQISTQVDATDTCRKART